jgi:hypothetical protein
MQLFEMSRKEFIGLAGEEIIQVFYAPHKAFKKIVRDAKFLGPILILVVFVIVQVGASYVVASKSYLEQTVPTSDQGDIWIQNAALWEATPNVTITNNYVDYINSTSLYLNTTSIEFVANSNNMQIFLYNLGQSVDCSADGYTNLSVRVKVVSPNTVPETVTLTLFSVSPAINFATDLTSEFSNTTIAEQHLWNNLTIPLNTNAWTLSNSAASWSNITGLMMNFTWPASSSASVDLRLDGLFFRGVYKTSLDVYGSSVLLSTALSAATPFLFEWLALTALIYVLIKGLKGNVVWKPVMVSVGFALAVLVVQSLILLVTYSTSLPNINYPLEILAGIPGEADVGYAAVTNTISQVLYIGSIVQIIIYIWVIALGTFIVREVTALPPPTPIGTTAPETEPTLAPQQFGWMKSLLVSAVAFVLTITILGFLGIA